MRLHIGIDDTDSRMGGCTTYIAALLVEQFSHMGVRFADYPNIIRLNPNVPYKTRGNAAIAIRLHVPESQFEVVKETSIQALEENSCTGQQGTDPAIVFLRGNPTLAVRKLSRKALAEIVSVPEALRTLSDACGSAVVCGTGIGLVGALAAAGNLLEGDHTYELIAYRSPQNLGKPRLVDDDSVIKMDQLTSPHTFNSYDAVNRRVLIKPHGPDPVLVGIRGETSKAVRVAFKLLRIHEPIDRWVIFRTNHGTDAHFQMTRTAVRPNSPTSLHGIVYRRPLRIPGGHVFLDIQIPRRIIRCAAFEPTGKFKETVAKLIPGDEVTVFGGVREHYAIRGSSITVNLEKIIVERLVDDVIAENPLCPRCGKRLKSAGRGQGFECRRCKYALRTASKVFNQRKRDILPGTYIPDKRAHRHLTKPFSRYGFEKRRWDGKTPLGVWHRP